MAAILEEIIHSVEMWMRLIKKPQSYVDPTLDPVLLVPGIAGSVLKAVDDQNGKEERVWVRLLSADYEFRTKLWSRFDPSTGKTESLNPKTSVKVPEDRFGLYAIDTLDPDMIIGRDCVYYFHDMIVEMIRWGFQEGKTLFGFGYDFRQSNRLQETMDRLSEKLESIYNASGGKKISIISHSMGGLLVKCFMCLHTDVFEKYVKNWIAITAPFQGAPGYVSSTFLNGMSFVEGWEQNFFISKWSMHQLLIECPGFYELMACLDFNWEHNPTLELWRKRLIGGKTETILESYPPLESVQIFKDALSSNTVNYDGVEIPMPFNMEILKWANETRRILSQAKVPSGIKFFNVYGTNLDTPHSVCYGSKDTPVEDLRELRFFLPEYICVDGDGTVPTESAKADGLNAEARVGIPGEHRGILSDPHLFRILKHWLSADHDPFYNPLNDYVILPTLFEIESHKEKGLQMTALKEEWEIISGDTESQGDMSSIPPLVSSITLSQNGNQSSRAETFASIVVRPQRNGNQHVKLNALSVHVDAGVGAQC